MSLYIESLRFIPCSYDLFIPVSELPIYDLFIPVSKKCQHFHTIKCVKMYEVTHHRLMGARCKTPFRKAMVRQRFRTWFCWGLRPSFDLFIPVYTSSLDLRPHVQCHSIFWAFCPVFNLYLTYIFCPIFNLFNLKWAGQESALRDPNLAIWSQSADLVPAQVLHVKVQSCRADTRKTSFWIGAIREAKESSAAEKQ